MRNIQRLAAVLSAAAFLLTGTLTGPAQATATVDGIPAKALAYLFKMHPQAKLLDSNTVLLEPGVELQKVAPSQMGILVGSCQYQRLCLWSNAGWTGYKLSLWACGYVNLTSHAYPDGGSWSDRPSSIVNNQTSGTVSFFWDGTDGSGYLGPQHSYGYRENLSLDVAESGGNWDNRMSRVFVC
jgi:hypothetical protein